MTELTNLMLSSAVAYNANNYLMALDFVNFSSGNWDRPRLNNMSLTNTQRSYASEGNFRSLYQDRWETSRDPVARTSAIGWDAALPSMRVTQFERTLAAVTWNSMEAYLKTQGYHGNANVM